MQAGNRSASLNTGGRNHGARRAQAWSQQRGNKINVKELVYQHRRRFKGKANEVFERGDLEVQEFFESQKAKDTAIKEKREVNKIINGEQQNQKLVGDKEFLHL